MVRQRIVVDNEELETCKKFLTDFMKLEKNGTDYANALGLRRLPYDLNSGLEYLKLLYKEELREKVNMCPLECAIVGKGVNHLLSNKILIDWAETREYLLKHPSIKLTTRFRASANEIYRKDYATPYYTPTPRKHYIDIPSLSRLGHLAAELKMDIYYLYPIAHLYGQLYYMNALNEIPNQKVYESLELELLLFEEQIEEELDVQKIKYKLYSTDENGVKRLKTLQKTTKIENYSFPTTNIDNPSKITQQLQVYTDDSLYVNTIEKNNKNFKPNAKIKNAIKNIILTRYPNGDSPTQYDWIWLTEIITSDLELTESIANEYLEIIKPELMMRWNKG